MIESEVIQLNHRAAQLDHAALVAYHFVGQHRMGILQYFKALFGQMMCDHARAGILEYLAAGDVIKVMVAVDHVLDGFVGDLADFIQIRLPAGGSAIGHGVGYDHAVVGDDENRLVIDVAKNVNAVRAIDLGDLNRRARGCLRKGGAGQK